jgi:hypothetical protein
MKMISKRFSRCCNTYTEIHHPSCCFCKCNPYDWLYRKSTGKCVNKSSTVIKNLKRKIKTITINKYIQSQVVQNYTCQLEPRSRICCKLMASTLPSKTFEDFIHLHNVSYVICWKNTSEVTRSRNLSHSRFNPLNFRKSERKMI